jgi:uroporphyrinogen decarboxylase
MTSRNRLRTTLSRHEPDRLPMCEICYWPQTLERWRQEGLPEDKAPGEHFGLDSIALNGPDCSLQLPAEVLEECDEWKLERDSCGATHKIWKNAYATPSEVDHLIKTRADWDQYKDRLQPTADRVGGTIPDHYRTAAAQGNFSTFDPTEPLWWALRTVGMERALIAMAQEPTWIEEMIEAQTELSLALTRQLIAGGVTPDAIWFFSDLCYRNGMFFSPRFYRDHVMGYHQRFAELCHEHDMFLILHCCGDVREFVPLLIEAGFDCIQPLEARAGNDVRELKALYGDRISFFGNINMDVLARGDREEITHEVVTKVETAKAGGGYIWHSDHSVPPTVSFEAYSLAVELAKAHGSYA